MSQTFTLTLGLSIGGDEPIWEGEVTVTYGVQAEEAEVGPAYDHGGLPYVPAMVQDVFVTHIDGRPVSEIEHGSMLAGDLEDHITLTPAVEALLLERAAQEVAADYADAMEYRAEARREDAMLEGR